MASSSERATATLTSASRSAMRISRRESASTDSEIRPCPRSVRKIPWSRSERLSSTLDRFQEVAHLPLLRAEVVDVVVVRRKLERDALDDLEAVTLERHVLAHVVR